MQKLRPSSLDYSTRGEIHAHNIAGHTWFAGILQTQVPKVKRANAGGRTKPVTDRSVVYFHQHGVEYVA